MRRYVHTPSGLLGLITLALIGMLAVMSFLYFRSIQSYAKRTECIATELGAPWKGLKVSLDHPPGDQAAREMASAAISRGIERLEHLDRHC